MTIETDQVCFGYGRQPAVSDVSLKLKSGVFYGILGPNGCGKTTLVDLLIRHRTPDAGVISYQGKPLAKYSRKQIARRFALVPQQYARQFSVYIAPGRHDGPVPPPWPVCVSGSRRITGRWTKSWNRPVPANLKTGLSRS